MEQNPSYVKIECPKCGCINKSNSKYCRECGFELPKVVFETPQDNQKKKPADKKKMNLPQIVGIIVGAIVMVAVQQIFFKAPSYDKVMMKWADEINKTCPFMVDKDTRLDNAIALPNKVIQYNYTLVNTEKSEIDTVAFREAMEPSMINTIKTNPDMKIQRDNKTTLSYLYKDKNGNHIITIYISPDKYL